MYMQLSLCLYVVIAYMSSCSLAVTISISACYCTKATVICNLHVMHVMLMLVLDNHGR